ncbi:glycine cleavage system aminomethyltransferase GcvT, partial [Escherichia coli]|nr:glycine cleavage system aminomethyltransferase GcvT [Escherichia coli]
TTPVEAALTWAIQKARRTGGARAGGFPGAAQILGQFDTGAPRARVGLRPEGRARMREGTLLFADAEAADPIGAVTSGGFGPSVEAPISMGYVAAGQASDGTIIYGEVRGKRLPAVITALPFRPATYKR